jgi:N-acetyl-gamma-glutamyl-phosphate reductase
MLDSGSIVIDFGADFRLKNKKNWEKIYKQKHPNWDLVKQSVYGINELNRNEIKTTKIVANPGCFASSSILALAPLFQERIIDTQKIIVDGMSGTAGAGNGLEIALHHPEIHNNVLPYNVVDHRHTYEIEQELSLIAKEKVTINFSSYYVPISRGILTANHCFPVKNINRRQLLDLYKEYYKDDYFVKILDIPKDDTAAWNYKPYPWISAVSGTNYCHIGVDIDEKRNRIVVFCVLDSIGKGGAQVGVQNMNIIFGLDETMGLDFCGSHPY